MTPEQRIAADLGPVSPTTWDIADKLDALDAAAVARRQARRFEHQDTPAMPAKPAGVPLVRLGQGDYTRDYTPG